MTISPTTSELAPALSPLGPFSQPHEKPIPPSGGPTQGMASQPNKTHKPKVRRRENVFHKHGNVKETRVVIFLSDKTDFKTNTVTRDKEGLNIMIEKSIQ